MAKLLLQCLHLLEEELKLGSEVRLAEVDCNQHIVTALGEL